MTQLCIADWTTATEPQYHAHAKPTGRFTCRCSACGKRWTTRDVGASYAKHNSTCDRVRARIAAGRPVWRESREITGTFKAGVKCDARCQGAIGHDCECSCGGVNHGIGVSL